MTSDCSEVLEWSALTISLTFESPILLSVVWKSYKKKKKNSQDIASDFSEVFDFRALAMFTAIG